MTIGIMQPYFMPYIGYWQLINAVDKYIIYDDVNFIKSGWINRNYILVEGNKKMFTIELSEASCHKLINKIEIKDNFRKLKKTIEMNYCKAPHFNKIMPLLYQIFDFPEKNLSQFITNSLIMVSNYLSIETEFILSSDIKKDNSLKGECKILEICRKLQANQYINPIGGQQLYSKDNFAKKGITLHFLSTHPDISYNQFNTKFTPYLSILDVMMFNSPSEINRMLNYYSLI